jgi:hypothetical protein
LWRLSFESFDFLKQMPNLLSLELTCVNIKTPEEDAFKELKNLQSLFLSSIERDYVSWPKYLPNLVSLFKFEQLCELELDMADKVTKIDGCNQQSLHSLKKLKIGNACHIDEEFLGYFPNLLYFELFSSQIFEITEGTFSKNRNLKKLVLVFCLKNNFLPENIFKNLSNLTDLYICESLSTLNENSFNGLENLRNFRLFSQNLIDFNMNILTRMPKLEELVLNEGIRGFDKDLVKIIFPNIIKIEIL